MKFSTMILASLIAAALLLPSVTPKKKSLSKSCRKKTKKKTFKGDGTYYGDIPVSAGNCAMRGDLSVYDGMIPVAINAKQYGGSDACGACIEGVGTGKGSGSDPIKGKFKAYVIDQCPECEHGDLDFATDGDGRWDIKWRFVPCKKGRKPDFSFEGSNAWYWKIQAVGCKGPVDKLWVNGKRGMRTDDNFFIVEDGVPFYGEQIVEVCTSRGEVYKAGVVL